ncbi:general transcription factor IIH subunit 1 [Patella vulgata]|uniref:general transcription factor IIH subunit 1 n=1 Tax=Patella vulgata TaxID=6465 RepID=UPI00217F2457|nr:general transcription factor IIH subunit 1 [Patella vulgata]XP_050408237.1 general transcription factor IIH subunit 1 [Patella vulgata]XP_050408238.1 general transcription factor IIH subunit 1 [Patella vulgata]XP_050408239.1 general transcription factor IIH subunit 1 [Patella vulgata]
MSRSSEEVLLIVNHVRQRKTDGTLYMMGERLAWMPGGKDTFTISHLYADIKSQKISPDTKEKVQLQLVFNDGGANTFHFNNPEGRPAMITDRDSVKEILQQLLPKFKRKISSELEEKNRILQDNPEIFQLYKDLVVSQVISAEEFWSTISNRLSNNSKAEAKQTVGVSPAFLADIKPQTDGCNGLKYNLTADIIESIFKTYPMVKKKHAESVPHQLSESEFWTRFFQSHYFHRDRSNLSSKDLFSDCAKNDEDEMKVEMSKKVCNPLMDLTLISDNSFGEEYRVLSEDTKKSSNAINLSMIRRFNHHSTMVLKACENNSQTNSSCDNNGDSKSDNSIQGNGVESANSSNNNNINGHISDVIASTSSSSAEDPPRKKKKIQEKLELVDLHNESKSDSVNLRLEKMERYLHGPTPITAVKYTTSRAVLEASESVHNDVEQWSTDLSNILSGSSAVSVLGELSPGGVLMQGTSHQQLHQMIPKEIQQEIQQQYSALCELLRHFWNCFPVSSKFLEEKVVKMRATLERFQLAKLNPLKDKLNEHHYNINLMGHLEDMLMAAYSKFETWQLKKKSKR